MRNNCRIIFKVLLFSVFIICLLCSNVLAVDSAIELNDWGGDVSTDGHDKLANTLEGTLTIIQIIGISSASIMLVVLAIKYIISSASDRAEIKKHAVVYVTGAVLMFAASGIVGIIRQFSTSAVS